MTVLSMACASIPWFAYVRELKMWCSTQIKQPEEFLLYYGYCGIPWHSGREAVSSTIVEVVIRASGYSGTRGVLPRCEEDDAIL